VIIIGILAAIAIPVFLAQREKAQDANLVSDVRNAAAAATSCLNDADAAGVDNDYLDCDTTGKLQPFGFNPSTNVTMAYAGTTATVWSAQGTHTNGNTATFSTTGADAGQVVGP